MIEQAARYDPSREPFGGIDQRVIDRHTGEVPPPDTSVRAWPPRSKGPLPPAERLPADLNIFTAQDEIDAWAWEHDQATAALETARTDLSEVEVEFIKQKATARRTARADPIERGRRTSTDIDTEVDERLAEHGILARKLDLETTIEIQLGRLFRAKDNARRLENYVRSLPSVSDHRP